MINSWERRTWWWNQITAQSFSPSWFWGSDNTFSISHQCNLVDEGVTEDMKCQIFTKDCFDVRFHELSPDCPDETTSWSFSPMIIVPTTRVFPDKVKILHKMYWGGVRHRSDSQVQWYGTSVTLIEWEPWHDLFSLPETPSVSSGDVQTRLRDERFQSVRGECVILSWKP